MNKKHGFTLIELLAVIVVLAIIALIATPIVMNTIKRSKKGAAERSADSYVKQVEVLAATERLNNNNILEGEYDINTEGNLTKDGKTYTVEMNGTKPSSGKIKITNGSVDQSSSNMRVGDYDVTYNSTKKTYEATEKGSTPQVLCTAKITATTGNVPSGNYAYGDEYTCELGDNDAKTFFVLETNGDNVSLIMDKNIDSNGKGTTTENTVAWCKSGSDNSCAADGALEYLKTSTASWTNLTESQISLPTAEQLASAIGVKFDDEGGASGLSLWLYDYLNGTTHPVNGLYGYWTSTPDAYASRQAWNVNFSGSIGYEYVDCDFDSHFGVRPVITVSKSKLG